MSAMVKEGDSLGGIKVFESRKKNKRRLVMASDSDEDQLVVSAPAKGEGVTVNNNTVSEMHSAVAEDVRTGETVVSREEHKRRLGIAGKDLKTGSDRESREIGGDEPSGKKIKSEVGDSMGSEKCRSGGINRRLESLKRKDKFMESNKEKLLLLKSDRKRSLDNGDDEFSRKKLKPKHAESLVYRTKEIGGSNKSLNVAESRDSRMANHEDSFHGSHLHGSHLPVKRRDEYDSITRKSRLSQSTGSKLEEENHRLGRSGRGELRKLKDTSVHDVGSKKEEDGCRSSQHNYIRMQGKSGVLRVLKNSKKFGSLGNNSLEYEKQSNSRRLRSSDKFDSSNSQMERKLSAKANSTTSLSRSTGKVSSSGTIKFNEAHAKQVSLPQQKSSKNLGLLHGETGKTAKKMITTETPMLSRKEAKNKLREQIKSILLGAGWTIEFRPRRGRDYEDAVYVSPQGSGYWSITKAYDVYLKQMGRTNDDMESSEKQYNASAERLSNCSETNSTAAIIPPDVLVMLKRTVVNKRKRKKEAKEIKNKVGFGRKKMTKENNRVKLYRDKGVRDDVGGTRAMKRKVIIRNIKRKGCALLVRGSNQDEGAMNGNYTPYVWKRTILSWMIDLGILPAYGKVRYMNKRMTKTLLDGRITRDGIQCSCCSKILTVSKFEIHAGSKLHQPYENIYVEASGVSLLQCQIKAWDKQESKRLSFFDVDTEGDDPNDDTCGICGDGGDLICCDGCPSTFHLGCLNIQMLPTGDWHCSNCSCKFCGVFSDSPSLDASPSDALFTCSQCARKYHKGCVADEDAISTASNNSNMFCGRSCRKVFKQLQKLIGVNNELEGGFSWSVLRRFDNPSKIPSIISQRVESNSKIAVAYAVMDECFVPIIDQRSGINLINNVVYNCGSNFNRLNFNGFCTFILERGDEITAAASVRIHDTNLAEMPFIGTRGMYRRQGMCRQLLKGIESALRSLKVEKLIIPAISELTDTWTNVFGFKPLGASQKREVKSVNLLVFPGTGLLQKSLMRKSSQQDAQREPGNSPDTKISVKANANCSVEEAINIKELKCDAERAENVLPVLEFNVSNVSPEAAGVHAPVCSALDSAADFESNDVKDIAHNNSHVEGDISHIKCSNKVENVLPVLEFNVSNVSPEAGGLHAPVCSALDSAADCESNDVKDIAHNNSLVEGDISHIKCSNKVSACMEEAKNEIEEAKGNCPFIEASGFQCSVIGSSGNDSNLECGAEDEVKNSNSKADGESPLGLLPMVKTSHLTNGIVIDSISKKYEHSKAIVDAIHANEEAKLSHNANGMEPIFNDASLERHGHTKANGMEPILNCASLERHGHTEASKNTMHVNDELKLLHDANGFEPTVIYVGSERYGHTEASEGTRQGDAEVKSHHGTDVLESNVNDEYIAVSLDV